MMLNAFGRQFETVYCDWTQPVRVLTCREQGKAAAGAKYLFLEFSDSEQVKKLLSYFFQLEKDKRWEDYLGCFVEKKAFYIAFIKHAGESLRELLKAERLSVGNRLFLIHDVLQKLLCWKLPSFLETGLLEEKSILVADGHAFFDYRWAVSVLQVKGEDRADYRLADFLEEMFKGELRRLKPPALMTLLAWLRSEKPKELLEIYDRWSQCRSLLEQELENDEPLLGKWKAGLLARVELFQGILKAGAAAMIYLALLVSLAAGYKKLEQEEAKKIEEGVKFTQIGVLELTSEESSTEEN